MKNKEKAPPVEQDGANATSKGEDNTPRLQHQVSPFHSLAEAKRKRVEERRLKRRLNRFKREHNIAFEVGKHYAAGDAGKGNVYYLFSPSSLRLGHWYLGILDFIVQTITETKKPLPPELLIRYWELQRIPPNLKFTETNHPIMELRGLDWEGKPFEPKAPTRRRQP
jgi:hypothetical protein